MKSIVLEPSKRLPLGVWNDTARAGPPGIRGKIDNAIRAKSDWPNVGQSQMMHGNFYCPDGNKRQQGSMVLISE
jgi:hypothetical protein